MTEPRVTEHAVLRYMERVLGLDVEGVRKHILDTCTPAIMVGASSLKTEGVRFEFVNYAVTTVLPDGQMPNLTKQERLGRRKK